MHTCDKRVERRKLGEGRKRGDKGAGEDPPERSMYDDVTGKPGVH